ncbi:hypothetical protein PA7559_15540 [Pseudoalteromonas distincta]
MANLERKKETKRPKSCSGANSSRVQRLIDGMFSMVIPLYRYICMLIDLNAYKKFNNFYKNCTQK